MKSKKIFLAGICLSIMSIMILPAVTSAAYFSPNYTHQDSNVNSDIAYQMKPSEIVELYPMAEEEEASIVHVVPQCPVTIDGVLYEGKYITLFNGQRLHFTTDKKGNLYAFTDAVKMEELLEKEYGYTFELPADKKSREVSYLYSDWLFNGIKLECAPGQQHEDLADYGLDNCISSAKVSDDAAVVLWDYANFGGDSRTLPQGSDFSMLTLQGWNDRASSIS
jgi:hypothetical protein